MEGKVDGGAGSVGQVRSGVTPRSSEATFRRGDVLLGVEEAKRKREAERSAAEGGDWFGAKYGRLLTREDVAAFLQVSMRKVRRLELRGVLRRCAGLEPQVRFNPSDVLRLASARRED